MADTTYLISDVVALAGVSAPQLRSWERAGLLQPARSSGGVRVYAAEDVARVRLIRRSLDNPGRRGSLRRLAERLAADDLRAGPEDWAGLDGRPAGPSDVIVGIGWQAVVDALPAPVAVWDRDGVLAHANPALTALLTQPGPDGGPTLDPAPSDTARSDTASLGDILAAAGPLSPRWVARVGVPQEEVPLILPVGPLEGRTVWHAVPLLGPDGAPRGAAGLGRDISGEALAHLAREGRLAAAARDLRAPLGVVLGNLELARRVQAHGGRAHGGLLPVRIAGFPPPADDRLAHHLEAAEVGARGVLRALDTLLDAAAAAAGDLLAALDPADVDLARLAADAVDHAAATTRRHTLRVQRPDHPVSVAGDRTRLRELLDNLLANALAFSPDGGPVELRLAAEERDGCPWALLRIEDRGVGIPADDLPFVFQRYRRGRDAARSVRGSGLGLYAARAIASAHGGDLWVERTATRDEATGPDGWHGTIVALALPLRWPNLGVEPPVAPPAPQEAP